MAMNAALDTGSVRVNANRCPTVAACLEQPVPYPTLTLPTERIVSILAAAVSFQPSTI